MSKEYVTIIIPRMVLKVPFVRKTEDPKANFTRAERRVFDYLTTCKTHKEIANALNIGEQAAKFHASNIYRKVGVKSRLEFLARYGKAEPEAPQP